MAANTALRGFLRMQGDVECRELTLGALARHGIEAAANGVVVLRHPGRVVLEENPSLGDPWSQRSTGLTSTARGATWVLSVPTTPS